ncbi:hypothetical protein MA16_Dca012299 [Dendrobium catenatum]|uniref:Uncharacterized protein n=1 Tax=Dendrobium catenatum TaxID=906689 RepID=A0A2I0WR97_9ASPA|nr:hypothetical protein MA16_Dca012299 [Dendrobium catenatum]
MSSKNNLGNIESILALKSKTKAANFCRPRERLATDRQIGPPSINKKQETIS